MNIVCVGECTRDYYEELGIQRVGGISLNFAVNARRAGVAHVAVVSCVGSDGQGAPTRDKLEREGVDASHLHMRSGATASQVIRLGKHGERFFPERGYDPGVLSAFHLDDEDRRFIARFDVVCAPYFRQIEHLFHPAMKSARPDARRVVDLLDGADLGPDLSRVDEILGIADLVFISGDAGMVERLLPHSRRAGTLIVVTHGAGGSSALVEGRRHFQPAIPVAPEDSIDSTGCGDAYQAAFTAEYFDSGSIALSMERGSARAAGVLRHLGATGD